MTAAVTTRAALKSDAAEIALLVNIAVHGGMARGWAHSEEAEGTYDPLEVGRLDMMSDDEFGWRNCTMAEVDGEVTGMLLGYRKADEFTPVGPEVTGFMRPIEELEADAHGTWFISMLGVHIGWRGKGVGTLTSPWIHTRLLAGSDLQLREIMRTNDMVLVSAVGALLDGANIHHLVLDQNMSVIEGSLGIIPRRILVHEDADLQARRVLTEAGLAHELRVQD